MANLTPDPVWEDVYQIEPTDRVLGGAGGVSNVQAQSLANQALYIRKHGGAMPFLPGLVYDIGDQVKLNNGDIVVSEENENSTDPNIDMSGWGRGDSASRIIDESGKTQQQINDIALREFNVLKYGADPTGTNNSHDAFVACAQALSENGSGKYVIPYGDYLVGKQTKQDSTSWRMFGEYLVDLRELDTVVIEFQGGQIRNKDGLYYGQFDANLNPINAPGSVPSRCSGGIMFNLIGNKSLSIIGSMVLDGNLTGAIIGGNFGDFGIQIEYDGFYTNGNMSLSHEANITTKDFGRDGYYIGARYLNKNGVVVEFTDNDVLPYSVLRNFTAILNARQGLSFTGGSGVVEDCHFEKIGKGRLTETLPRAGIDLEQESGVLRDVKVLRSTFVDCGGIGLVNTSGVIRRDSYLDCRFIGNTNYSLYAASGVFERCHIVGRAGIGGTDATFKDRNNIPTFKKCIFSSRSIDAAGGPVYASSFLLETIFAGPAKSYALFDQCDFYAVDGFIFAGTNAAYTFNKCKFYIASENAANGLRSQFLKCNLIDCEFIDLRENPVNTLTIGRDNNDPSVVWNNVSITSNTGKLAFSFVSGFGTVSQRQQDVFARHSLVLANNQNTVVTSPTSRTGTMAVYSKSALPTLPTDAGNPFYAGDLIENWSVNSSSWTEARCISSGYSCSAVWAASTAYALNQYVSANSKVYKCVVAGTSGTTAPNHSSGTAVDGSVTWEYVGALAVFRQSGAKASTVANATGSDDTSTKLNQLITNLRAAGYIV